MQPTTLSDKTTKVTKQQITTMRNNKLQMTSVPDKTTDELEQIEQPSCAYEECLCNKFQNDTIRQKTNNQIK